MMRRSLVIWSSGVLLLGLLGSCKQKEGDRCNLDSDCDSGLFCCVKPADRARGGICTLPEKCDLTQTDSGFFEAGTPDHGVTPDRPRVDLKAPAPDTKAATDTAVPAPDTLAPTPDQQTGQ